METSLLAPQGSSLLLQLSAPRFLFLIPVPAQVHEMVPPAPPLSHCYNNQMHFIQPINCFVFYDFYISYAMVTVGIKKIVLLPVATTWQLR